MHGTQGRDRLALLSGRRSPAAHGRASCAASRTPRAPSPPRSCSPRCWSACLSRCPPAPRLRLLDAARGPLLERPADQTPGGDRPRQPRWLRGRPELHHGRRWPPVGGSRRRPRLLGDLPAPRRRHDRPRQPRRHRGGPELHRRLQSAAKRSRSTAATSTGHGAPSTGGSAAPTSTAPSVDPNFITAGIRPLGNRGRRRPRLLGEPRHRRLHDRSRQPRRLGGRPELHHAARGYRSSRGSRSTAPTSTGRPAT